MLRRLLGRGGSRPLGGWLFRKAIVQWVTLPELRRQLPLAYRPFSFYCRLYFALRPQAVNLRFGRHVLALCARAHRALAGAPLVPLHFGDFVMYLDLTDPRFLHVVNEVRGRTDTKLLSQHLGQGDSFVDIGANQGAFSVLASTLLGEAGKVVAVEPQPRLAAAVERSLSANGFCRYEVHNVAMGSRDGEIDLLVPEGTSGRAGLFSGHSGANPHSRVPVRLRRFDDAVDWRSLPGRVFLKLDVEGSEHEFLAGAREMLTARRPPILMEIHPGAMSAAGTTVESIKALLAELGYRTYRELDEPDASRPLSALEAGRQRNVLFDGD